jgi:hypothetical protein
MTTTQQMPNLPTSALDLDGEAVEQIERVELAIPGGHAVIDAIAGDYGSIDITASVDTVSELDALIAKLTSMRGIAAQIEGMRA